VQGEPAAAASHVGRGQGAAVDAVPLRKPATAAAVSSRASNRIEWPPATVTAVAFG
jgi:hypothetical protein